MNAQMYLQNELSHISKYSLTENDKQILETLGIESFIFKKVMSKKFRKYAANPELIDHIQKAIAINVKEQKPINFTFLHGAYKLWRLDEAPEADWAELFACMYFSEWLAPLCAIYKPGVWFDFFVDDLIVPKIDNIPLTDVKKYISSFQNIHEFLKPYLPKNLKLTITTVGSQFSSAEAFDKSIEQNLKTINANKPQYSDRQLKMVELNARPTKEQLADPLWREKIHMIHDAYLISKKETGYHYKPEKILTFCQPLKSGTVIAVGTTKTSIAKFWVGVGILKKTDDSYKEYIFSPKQLSANTFISEPMKIKNLKGKNFKTIKILLN